MTAIPLPVPPLSDGVVRLRPFTLADAGAVTAALQDREISRWTATIPWPYSEQHARDWISAHEPDRLAGRSVNLAITAGGAMPLGAIGLDVVDADAGTGQVGYWVAREARGRGLATRAATLVGDWGLGNLDLRRLILFTIDGNVASARVAAKAGFQAVEVLPDHDLGSKRATVTRWERNFGA
ncbi:MAG TPA: GNAT family N-acetyltransferase [Gaiellales bacterium]|jgi:RimJ/RimL family protein N-acetyltransferase|nr:GNAT family N-acetyltransferase [Gaiellales bacterium]